MIGNRKGVFPATLIKSKAFICAQILSPLFSGTRSSKLAVNQKKFFRNPNEINCSYLCADDISIHQRYSTSVDQRETLQLFYFPQI